MRFDFDTYEFLKRMLPHHKRQTNRLALFNWPLLEVQELVSDYREWRLEMIYQSNVTGQKLSLVDFLNRKVTDSGNSIDIVETEDGSIYFSTFTEATDPQDISLLSEDTDVLEIPKLGEDGSALTVDFRVIIPTGVNPDEVDRLMARYVLAGKTYEITTI